MVTAAGAPSYARRVIAVAFVVSGFVLLGVSAARHAHWHDVFVGQLGAQDLWPKGSEPAVAWVVTGIEAVVGSLGVLLLSFGVSASALAPLLAALVATGVAFVGLQVFLLVSRPDAPCGCDPTRDAKVGLGTLLKAAWPAVAGLVGLAALPREAVDDLSLAVACVAVFLGLALAWLVDSLPTWFDHE